MKNSVKAARPYRSSARADSAQATRERILAAARVLFSREGFEAVTIAAIAERAAVATPTIYAAFGSKTRLLVRVRGWPPDVYQGWLAELLVRSLLAPEPGLDVTA